MPTRPPKYKATHKAKGKRDKRPSASRRGYGAKWQAARAEFLHTHTRCVKCKSKATVVDHITPHKGDLKLFWSRRNWQPMCTSCHSRKTCSVDGGFGNKRDKQRS